MSTNAEANRGFEPLNGRKITMLGYGSQGRAQALNLRDSGADITVGVRPGGNSWKQAVADGWEPKAIDESVKAADVICMMLPDMAQPAIYRALVEPNARTNSTLLFAHGFCIHYGTINPREDLNIIMVSPKGVGAMVRSQFEEGQGVPALVAVQQDVTGESKQIAMEYARAMGSDRAGIYETTFGEETEADLFSEQAILCGGIPALIKAGWETLVDAGYQPEVAYFECLHEVKLIVDLLYEGGLSRMQHFISDTAAYGGLVAGDRIVTDETRKNMRQLLAEIKDGTFAKKWQQESESGGEQFASLVDKEISHPVEKVGKKMRSQFSWMNAEPGP